MTKTRWCPGTPKESLSSREERDGKARCPRCGRVITVRRNAYGTSLGMARHKAEVKTS